MKIYLSRHGQTNLNKQKLMQGRTDEPLNETGISQAKQAHEFIKDVKFDAIYSSPLKRAKTTASIMANVPESEIIVEPRIIEVNFGDYELKQYSRLGAKFNMFWILPEIFPAPKGVEPVDEMIARTHEFLKELETKDFENVLVVCHGGILRPMFGYLMDKKSGLCWRPRPTNCEIRVFESNAGIHTYIDSYKLDS